MAILTERVTWKRPKAPGAARYTPDLTDDEQANVRAALRVLRVRLGGYARVAEALHVNFVTLSKLASKTGKPKAGIALRVARFVMVPVEDVLSGAWPKPGSCPMCGRCDDVSKLPGARP